MPVIISNNKMPVTVNAQPCHPIMLSSKLTDTNNHTTPGLTMKRLWQAHKGPNASTTNQKNSKVNVAGASHPSTAPSATYDNMNDPVTTTACPGVASNISSCTASIATVPGGEDDSTVNGHTSHMTMEIRSINRVDSSGNKDEKTVTQSH
ncbi:hypothetical protein PAXRUDRAFT_28474 [Paxillus rubicundulus Ve08.2h10]|uniref:Uncharacterized protein n=1 Tax=Paxillus rubicundulus Ve08.2h10 TaxID=930991 RepID=A0A0D0DLC3_9AGAM|nr:hypothetical protein PAXRUDRAFT_28474 [Paxillus rubicundulus Ve08.2h10]